MRRVIVAIALALLLFADTALAQAGYATFSEFTGLDSVSASSVQIRIAPIPNASRTAPRAGPPRAFPGGGPPPNLPPGVLGNDGGDPRAVTPVRERRLPEPPRPSVRISVAGGNPDTTVFDGYSRPGLTTGWDDVRAVSAEVPVTRLLAALEVMKEIREAQGGMVDSMGVCLLTLVRGDGYSLRVYETTLPEETAARLFRLWTPQFGVSSRAWDALAMWTCGCDVATVDGPASPSRLEPALEGFGYDTARRELSAVLSVRNRSRLAIAGPMVVAIRPRARRAALRLLDADGVTCRVIDPGTPFVRFAPAAPLAPGERMERVVRFAAPRRVNAEFDVEAMVEGEVR